MFKYILAMIVSLLAATAAGADELLIFTMPGCRPCAHMKVMLTKHPELVRDFQVVYFDITEAEETARVFNVGSVPTFVRLREDKEVARAVGAMTERKFKQWVQQHNP